MPQPVRLPQIESWPKHREAPTIAELADVRAYTELSAEDRQLQQKQVAEYLGTLELIDTSDQAGTRERTDLAVIADRVVDLYHKAYNKEASASAHDYEIAPSAIDAYAHTLLDELLLRHDEGRADVQFIAEDLARRLMHGERVANPSYKAHLVTVGLCDTLRHRDILMAQTEFQAAKAEYLALQAQASELDLQKNADPEEVEAVSRALQKRYKQMQATQHAVAIYRVDFNEKDWQLPDLSPESA